MNVKRRVLSCSISALVTMLAVPAFADCAALPDFSQLRSALAGAITPAAGANGGLGFHMWGTLVANDISCIDRSSCLPVHMKAREMLGVAEHGDAQEGQL